MDGDKCTKNFPKQFKKNTALNVDGYPCYRCLDNGQTVVVTVHGALPNVDNRWIVLNNLYLSQKFQVDINLEACTSNKSVKYLFKYIYKAMTAVTLRLQSQNS